MKHVTRIVSIIIILSLFGSAANAEITLKKKFWSGWNYSNDGTHWEKVGYSGNGLKMLMGGDEEALKLMDSYTSNKTGAAIFGAVSGFCIGWWLGGEISDKEDNDPAIAYVGLGLLVPSIIFEGIASKRLKASVADFNGTASGMNLGLAPIRNLASTDSPLGLVVSYRF